MKTVDCKHCRGTGKQIDQVDLGESLRRLRKKSGLRLKDMARLLNLSTPYISDLELGRRQWHTDRIEAFKLLCSATTKNKTKGTK